MFRFIIIESNVILMLTEYVQKLLIMLLVTVHA
jgi:hypothetical protein